MSHPPTIGNHNSQDIQCFGMLHGLVETKTWRNCTHLFVLLFHRHCYFSQLGIEEFLLLWKTEPEYIWAAGMGFLWLVPVDCWICRHNFFWQLTQCIGQMTVLHPASYVGFT